MMMIMSFMSHCHHVIDISLWKEISKKSLNLIVPFIQYTIYTVCKMLFQLETSFGKQIAPAIVEFLRQMITLMMDLEYTYDA